MTGLLEIDLFSLKDLPEKHDQERLNELYKIKSLVSDILHKCHNNKQECFFLYDIEIQYSSLLTNYLRGNVIYNSKADFGKIINLGLNKILLRVNKEKDKLNTIFYKIIWYNKEYKWYFRHNELEDLEILDIKLNKYIKYTQNIIDNEKILLD